MIEQRLGIQCSWSASYKLCDLKPTLGYLHPDLISGYDFWGFGDLDVIYGDIRRVYTEEVFSNDIISSHAHITAGHLTLVRNTERFNQAFKRVRGWRELLARSDHRGFDEFHWSHQFSPLHGNLYNRLKQRIRSPKMHAKSYLAEQFSSALYPLKWIDGGMVYPDHWYWRNGSLTAQGADGREFLYLHFTNWQSNRWNEGNIAAWKLLDDIDHCPTGVLTRFRIGPEGFCPLDQ